jgi:hypothetical protein
MRRTDVGLADLDRVEELARAGRRRRADRETGDAVSVGCADRRQTATLRSP